VVIEKKASHSRGADGEEDLFQVQVHVGSIGFLPTPHGPDVLQSATDSSDERFAERP
jgi:hypothetical protein